MKQLVSNSDDIRVNENSEDIFQSDEENFDSIEDSGDNVDIKGKMLYLFIC